MTGALSAHGRFRETAAELRRLADRLETTAGHIERAETPSGRADAALSAQATSRLAMIESKKAFDAAGRLHGAAARDGRIQRQKEEQSDG